MNEEDLDQESLKESDYNLSTKYRKLEEEKKQIQINEMSRQLEQAQIRAIESEQRYKQLEFTSQVEINKLKLKLATLMHVKSAGIYFDGSINEDGQSSDDDNSDLVNDASFEKA